MSNNESRDNATASGETDALVDARERSAANNELLSSLKIKNRLNIANWNVRTTSQRMNLLADELLRYKVDIAIITEARIPGSGSLWIDTTEGEKMFKCLYSGSVNDREYGVAFMIHKKYASSVAHFEAINDRIGTIEFTGTINLSIIGVYAPTNTHTDESKDSFYDNLQLTLNSIPEKNVTLVVGDMNAETGTNRNGWSDCLGPFGVGSINDNSLRMLSFASHNRLVLSNSFFRHKLLHKITWSCNTGKSEKEIDHFLINKRFQSAIHDVRVKRGACIGSDHYLVMAKLKVRLQSSKKSRIHTPVDPAALQQFQVAKRFEIQLSNKFQSLEEEGDVEREWSNVRNALQDTLKDVCPLPRTRKKPWISDETLRLVDQRRDAMKRNDNQRRNALSRQIKGNLIEDEEKWWNSKADIMEQAALTGNSKMLYSTLRSLTPRPQYVSESVKYLNGNIVKCKDEKVKRWREHFQVLLNRPNPAQLDDELFNDSTAQTNNDISDHPPDFDEVDYAVKKLKSGKAAGIDSIPAEALKAGGQVLTERLTSLIHAIWDLEIVPQDWKDSIIVPVYKKGSKMDCNNYRGISLLSTAGKVLTSIIRSRITGLYESESREEQSGFRQGRGCIDQIFSLRQILERRIRNGRDYTATFIDFAAAFDSVHRSSLWSILRKLGIPEKLVRVLSSFYCNGLSKVKVYGELSEGFPIATGVRQGCIISPCLFNVVLDYIMKKSAEGLNGLTFSDNQSVTDLDYADDIVYLSDNEADTQLFVDRLNSYASLLGLTINTKKTKTMSSLNLNIVVNGEQIEQVNSFTYLGSILSAETSACGCEIMTRIEKSMSQFSRLGKAIFNRKDLSTKTKMRIYNSAIIPVLLYGAETWTYTVADMKKLEVFQMNCLRKILGISILDMVPNKKIREYCENQPSLHNIIQKSRLRWFGHVARMSDARIPKRILFSERPQSWRCPRTAPRLSWEKHLTNDINIGGIRTRPRQRPLDAAADMAQDRPMWRAFIRDIRNIPIASHNQPGLRR